MEDKHMEEIAKRLQSIEQHFDCVPEETHKRHHILIEQLIDERKVEAMFWTDLRSKLATTGIVGAISLLGAAVLYAMIHYIKSNATGS